MSIECEVNISQYLPPTCLRSNEAFYPFKSEDFAELKAGDRKMVLCPEGNIVVIDVLNLDNELVYRHHCAHCNMDELL